MVRKEPSDKEINVFIAEKIMKFKWMVNKIEREGPTVFNKMFLIPHNCYNRRSLWKKPMKNSKKAQYCYYKVPDYMNSPEEFFNVIEMFKKQESFGIKIISDKNREGWEIIFYDDKDKLSLSKDFSFYRAIYLAMYKLYKDKK